MGAGLGLDEIIEETFDEAFGGEGLPIAGVRRDAETSPVSADGDAHPFVFDDAGQLKVRANVVATVEPSDAEYAEDSAHTSGDVGLHMLAVRQDTLASSTSADGDYASLKVDEDGALYTRADLQSAIADDQADAGNPIKIGGRAVDGALTAVSDTNDRYDLIGDMFRRTWVNTSRNIGLQSTQTNIGTSAVEVLAVPLVGRREVTIQNEGGGDVYVGASGVTTSTGIKISKRSSATFEWGEDIDIFMIADNAGTDVRFLESA